MGFITSQLNTHMTYRESYLLKNKNSFNGNCCSSICNAFLVLSIDYGLEYRAYIPSQRIHRTLGLLLWKMRRILVISLNFSMAIIRQLVSLLAILKFRAGWWNRINTERLAMMSGTTAIDTTHLILRSVRPVIQAHKIDLPWDSAVEIIVAAFQY